MAAVVGNRRRDARRPRGRILSPTSRSYPDDEAAIKAALSDPWDWLDHQSATRKKVEAAATNETLLALYDAA
jgi:hypothetical protein